VLEGKEEAISLRLTQKEFVSSPRVLYSKRKRKVALRRGTDGEGRRNPICSQCGVNCEALVALSKNLCSRVLDREMPVGKKVGVRLKGTLPNVCVEMEASTECEKSGKDSVHIR